MLTTVSIGDLSASGSLIWLTVWRIILGIGVGADYPMSASVTSDRTNIRRRGTMLAYIFSNQGWGSLVGSVATIVVLACYKHVMDGEGETSKVDGGAFCTIAIPPLISSHFVSNGSTFLDWAFANSDWLLISVAYPRRSFFDSCLRNALPASHAARV